VLQYVIALWSIRQVHIFHESVFSDVALYSFYRPNDLLVSGCWFSGKSLCVTLRSRRLPWF